MTQNSGILDWGPLSLVRRNHGLEHATLNLLAAIMPATPFAGHSDQKGLWIFGEVSTDVLLETARTALKRMRAGESQLAIHANCGTNFVTAGVIGGTLGWLATLGTGNNFKKKLDRLPLMILVVTTALIAAQPLGPKVQEKFTASGNPGALVIKQIVRYERKGPPLHRILTGDGILQDGK
jgi:hypothetical protein